MSFYWITRLDSLVLLSQIMLGICITILCICFIIYFFNDYQYTEKNDCDYKDKKMCISFVRYSIVISIISLSGMMFIPTTKEYVAIYAIDNVMDYVNGSEQIRHLPDKFIEYLNDIFEKENKYK